MAILALTTITRKTLILCPILLVIGGRGVTVATDCGFEMPDGVVQPFLMGCGEGLKLDADPVYAGPAYDGASNEDRDLVFRGVE
jgi:hypothetical protein